MTYLGLIAIALILFIVFQIGRASDLVMTLRSDRPVVDDEQAKAQRERSIHGFLFMAFLILGLIAAFWSAWHYRDLYLPFPSSAHGEVIRSMFFWTLVSTVPVFVLTHIMLFYFSWRYQEDDTKLSRFFPEDNRLELAWTVVPAIVMVLLVTNGIINWNRIMAPAPDDSMVVEVTGQQFYWTIRYAGVDNELGRKSVRLITDNNPFGQDWDDQANMDDFMAQELYLPADVPVLVKINSMDVLHNFFLPHFRVKMDAVPGIPTQFWFTPTITTEEMRASLDNPDFVYELACAELCGSSHYNMRKEVVVVEQDSFARWLNQQEPLAKMYAPSEFDDVPVDTDLDDNSMTFEDEQTEPEDVSL